MPSLRRGRLYIVFRLVTSSIVEILDLWERFVVCVEAGAALLHCVGFVAVFCMSSCTVGYRNNSNFFQSESVLEITELQKDPAVSKMNVFLSRKVHCKDSRI